MDTGLGGTGESAGGNRIGKHAVSVTVASSGLQWFSLSKHADGFSTGRIGFDKVMRPGRQAQPDHALNFQFEAQPQPGAGSILVRASAEVDVIGRGGK
jgi:hypothetical protein